jgi:oxygen-independent coproporphyrinogen-3 oxidase
VPFCARKCPYCDFNTYAVSKVPEDGYVAALIKELDLYRRDPRFYKRQVKTVFFGGGTPSILSDASISRIIDSVNQSFRISPEAEITLEANPNDADRDKLEGFKRGGVNRLSFGAQSFDSKALAFLGRDHKPEDIIQAVESSISVGLDNVSVDIIYGLPDQSLSALEEDLRAALELPITHLSTYSLTIEPGTPFYQRQERGFLKMPPDSRVAKMLDFIPTFLESRGLFRYEISNFSKPGRESAHNLVYWSGGDYLGLGAGAHSYCREYQAGQGADSVLISAKRWSNLALPAGYVEKVATQDDVVAWREQLQQKDLHFEFFYLGMRRIAGVSEEQFLKRFGFAIPEGIVSALNELAHSGFVIRDGDIIRLSAEGISLADSVFERLAGA